jgi:DNA-binding transcriptional MocR family regulator
MHRRLLLLALIAIVAIGMVAAQERSADPREGKTAERERPAETEEPREEARSGLETILERLRRASRLPRTAEDAREEGVDRERVREAIRTARERGVTAAETQEILETEVEEVRRTGNPDNFGAAVQELKQSGLRGRELAEAIHAEQVARGMKKPKKKHPGKHGRAKDEHSEDDDSSSDEEEAIEEEGSREGRSQGRDKGERKGQRGAKRGNN